MCCCASRLPFIRRREVSQPNCQSFITQSNRQQILGSTGGSPNNRDANVVFFFFFFLLPFRLSSTRTRSTLAPCPPTLSVTSRRGRWMSTRTRWRGNNKARKVCLTADARGAEPRPQLGLGFICLALFSLLVLFSCPEGGRQSLARLSLYGAYQKSFFYF